MFHRNNKSLYIPPVGRDDKALLLYTTRREPEVAMQSEPSDGFGGRRVDENILLIYKSILSLTSQTIEKK
jgi:hypothetical protein